MQITCSVNNINSHNFSNVFIHKLKQVVFFNEKRNVIDIYTELIVGAEGSNEPYSKSIIDSNFTLDFEWKKSSEIKLIKIMDLTDSYIKQSETTEKVSHGTCYTINNQNILIEKLQETFGSIDIKKNLLNIKCNEKYMFIQQDSTEFPVAICYNEASDKEINDEPFRLNYSKELHTGVEVVKWIKTTIYLHKKFNISEKFDYNIEFLNNSSCLTMQYCSIYFCLPNAFIMCDDTEAIYKDINGENNKDKKNNLSPATQDMELYYTEWEKHHIEECNIYRLSREKIFGKSIENPRRLGISFQIKSKVDKAIVQFFMGLIFSGVLSFGIDSGRMNEVTDWFPGIIPNDIQWILSCILIFIVMIIHSSYSEKANKRFKCYEVIITSIIFISWVLWVITVFVLARTSDDVWNATFKKTFIHLGAIGFIIINSLMIVYIILAKTVSKHLYARHIYQSVSPF